MALFYTGSRPVLKGRSTKHMIHPQKGEGVYSFWHLYSTDHVLDGAPTNNVVPGEGKFPHGLQMSRWFTGAETKFAIDNAGDGPRVAGARFGPLEFKGTVSIFASFGHVATENAYHVSIYKFKGVDASKQLASLGTGPTPVNVGGFTPLDYHGVDKALDNPGQVVTTVPFSDPYGHNHVLQHEGVPSSKAIPV